MKIKKGILYFVLLWSLKATAQDDKIPVSVHLTCIKQHPHNLSKYLSEISIQNNTDDTIYVSSDMLDTISEALITLDIDKPRDTGEVAWVILKGINVETMMPDVLMFYVGDDTQEYNQKYLKSNKKLLKKKIGNATSIYCILPNSKIKVRIILSFMLASLNKLKSIPNDEKRQLETYFAFKLSYRVGVSAKPIQKIVFSEQSEKLEKAITKSD